MNEKGLSTAIATSEPDTFDCPTITMGSVASKKQTIFQLIEFCKKNEESWG